MRLKSIYGIFAISFLVALSVYLALVFCTLIYVYFEGDRHLWPWRIPVTIGDALVYLPHQAIRGLRRLGWTPTSSVSGNLISCLLIVENTSLSSLSFMLCWSALEKRQRSK